MDLCYINLTEAFRSVSFPYLIWSHVNIKQLTALDLKCWLDTDEYSKNGAEFT